MNKKFEYFLNAIHYCLDLEEIRSTRIIEKCVLGLFQYRLFGYLYSGYPAFLSFILVGFYFRSCEEMNYLVVLAIASIPIGICYIPAYKAVFTKDRYLKYFKQFKKEDEHWHRKWKRITITFCIGSILMTLLGILAMWGVLLY